MALVTMDNNIIKSKAVHVKAEQKSTVTSEKAIWVKTKGESLKNYQMQ
jgi:hypothetical protein